MESAQLDSNISPEQLKVAQQMKDKGLLSMPFNWTFFTNADASELRPESAGLGVAMIGLLHDDHRACPVAADRRRRLDLS